MTVYIIMFCLILVFGFICFHLKENGILSYDKVPKKHRENIFTVIIFLTMLFVQGLRGFEVGADTKAYIDIFDLIIDGKDNINLFSFDYLDIEIGYVYLNLFIARLSTNHRFFLIVISAIMLLVHIGFLKKESKNLFTSIILFVGFGHFLTSMSSLRQYLALALALWTLPLLEKKKYLKALFFSVIAFSFHNSVIIFFVPLIIAYTLKKVRNLWLPVLIILIISLPFTMAILNQFLRLIPKYTYYNNSQVLGIGQLKIVMDAIYLLLLLYISKNRKVQTKSIKIYTIFLCFAIYTSLLGQYIAYAFRLSYYFDYILLLLVPELISLDDRYNKLMKLGFCALSFLLFIYLLSTNAAAMVPWEFM